MTGVDSGWVVAPGEQLFEDYVCTSCELHQQTHGLNYVCASPGSNACITCGMPLESWNLLASPKCVALFLRKGITAAAQAVRCIPAADVWHAKSRRLRRGTMPCAMDV